MMASLINAVLITGLFSFWIWQLKQDILRMQHTEGPTDSSVRAHGRNDPDETIDIDVHHAQRPMHHAYQNRKTRNRAGIPTWTIG